MGCRYHYAPACYPARTCLYAPEWGPMPGRLRLRSHSLPAFRRLRCCTLTLNPPNPTRYWPGGSLPMAFPIPSPDPPVFASYSSAADMPIRLPDDNLRRVVLYDPSGTTKAERIAARVTLISSGQLTEDINLVPPTDGCHDAYGA